MLKKPMTTPQKIALGYFVILAFVAGLNYIPGFKDDQGLICGVFELTVRAVPSQAMRVAPVAIAISAAGIVTPRMRRVSSAYLP